MTEKKRTRKPNGASTIYLGKDGKWHGRVTVGIKEDGTPDRRHVKRASEKEVIKAVRQLERERDEGKVRKTGERWTVKSWLTHWIENIAVEPNVAENTHSGYKVDVVNHLVPGLGAHKLDKLAPEHLEKFYSKLQTEKGLKPGGVDHVHRTLRAALNVAKKRGYLSGDNPATLAARPVVEEFEVNPYSVEDVRRLLEVASKERNSARWAIALALGLRQAEALGLRWRHLDLANGTIRVRRNRNRPKYKHGCGDPCGKKAGWCPQRVRTNKDTKDTKSKAGRRTVPVPAELVRLLEKQREEQAAEREKAGNRWHDGGWVFATEFGEAINPSTDYHAWKALLKAAGVPDGRLHDARHTAATTLLILGVPERTVMEIMGWASSSMGQRYQHVTDAIKRSVADQVNGLLWAPEQAADGPKRSRRRRSAEGK